jgi:signal transduction histidine kinase
MKRDLIEKLRPTLLDNVRLFQTLRWHMKTACQAASVPYTEDFPESEQVMAPEIRIAVFRIFQEALRHVLGQQAAGDLELKVEVTGDTLHCHLHHRNAGAAEDPDDAELSRVTSMHHRAQQVGGSLHWRRTDGGRHMHLQVPLATAED